MRMTSPSSPTTRPTTEAGIHATKSTEKQSSPPCNAVVWSYWHVRATLQYLTEVKHLRPDVQLDDRTDAKYKSYDDGTVAIDIGKDPSFAARPYYIPILEFHRADVAQRFTLKPVAPIDLPFGYDDRGRGWLYLVGGERRVGLGHTNARSDAPAT
jgi:hypothetical protein